MLDPCETSTSICLSFATISSGLYFFLGKSVLLYEKDILQVGPLQRGWLMQESRGYTMGYSKETQSLADLLAFLNKHIGK
jgi:hypothetical protein